MKKQTALIYGTILVAFSVTAVNSSAAQGYCNGIAYPCSNYDRNKDQCLKTAGCTYIYGSGAGVYENTYKGTAIQCNQFTGQPACNSQVGCYWVEQPNL